MIQETITQIENRLMTKLKATPPFNAINMSPSAVALWSNFLNTIATEIFTLQQLMNIFETEVESDVDVSSPETARWIKQRVLEFQYNPIDPQVVQVNSDLSVSYPIVNATLRIITQCSVTNDSSGGVIVKVASGSPLAPISAPQLAALTSYLDTILGGDISFVVVNENADTISIVGNIYYNGQYNSVIQASVITALNNYLSNLGFNGVVKVSDLISIIRAVPGVTDASLSQIAVAPDGGSPVNLVYNNTEQAREYQSNSGYIVNDPLSPFSSTLTFLIDNN